MNTILEFISHFQSPSNNTLFTEVACYWFAIILHERFPHSCIMYSPNDFHFATKISGKLYDITGLIEDDRDYVDWSEYGTFGDDAEDIIEYCIKLKGGD